MARKSSRSTAAKKTTTSAAKTETTAPVEEQKAASEAPAPEEAKVEASPEPAPKEEVAETSSEAVEPETAPEPEPEVKEEAPAASETQTGPAQEPETTSKVEAPSQDDIVISRIEPQMARYEAAMSRRIAGPAILRDGASALQSITQFVIEHPSDAVMKRLSEFYVKHANTLLSERMALRGTDQLSKAWCGRVEMMYSIMSKVCNGRKANVSSDTFVKMFNYSNRAKPIEFLEWVEKKNASKK